MFKSCSPYIKMFCEKGVNWHFSLTEELLDKVQQEDKMIFLHIGYISNVGIRESSLELFKDERVQKTLNDNFVSLIEDKEDKPESFLLALDLMFINNEFSYGPMNMFIMPDRRPIVAFSECDPENFLTIAQTLLRVKEEKRERLNDLAETLSISALNTGIIKDISNPTPISKILMEQYVDSWFYQMFNNGFIYKTKPFTPNPSALNTILDYISSSGNKKYMKKTEEILDHLQFSALFDVVDGGFFRQAQDYSCSFPLYEKTLEENSRFLMLYSAAFKLFNKESYRTTANLIFQFISNELKSNQGGYVNSTTILDKVENIDYYFYSLNEIKILFPTDYKEISDALGINSETDLFTKKALQRKDNTYKIITKPNLKMLRDRRSEHRGYYKDNRIITSSNATLVSALALASQYLNDIDLYKSAVETFEFIVYNNVDSSDGRLYRYTCNNEKYLKGYLSDYSYFIQASLNLYKVFKNKEFLSVAINYTDFLMQNFFKKENGMFGKSEIGPNHETIPFKRESNLDIVRPSGNSIMAGNLIDLFEITNNKRYLDIARSQIENITPNLVGSSIFLSSWANKIDKYLNSPVIPE